MDATNAPATQADIAQIQEETRQLFRAFEARIESLFKRFEEQIVATVYRLGDAAQMRLTEAEREAAAMKERLGTLEKRLMEIERLLDTKTQRFQ